MLSGTAVGLNRPMVRASFRNEIAGSTLSRTGDWTVSSEQVRFLSMKLGAALISFISVVPFSGAAERNIQLISSNPQQFWQPARILHWEVPTPSTAAPLQVEIDRDQTEQTIPGFGGCFNEKGWEALELLPDNKREEVLRALFDPAQGCGLPLGRIPMGANDYSLGWYSYDETPDDYSLQHFSIARDQEFLIPYIHQAQKFNPNLRFWTSPWCPPAWNRECWQPTRGILRNSSRPTERKESTLTPSMCRTNRMRARIFPAASGPQAI